VKALQNQFAVRELKIEDYPAILSLWESAGLSFRPNGRDHPDRLAEQLTSGHVFMLGLCLTEERLVGVVFVSHDERKGWINRLAVDPLYRNRGYGQVLIEACERKLLSLGINVFSALISEENCPSRALFEKCGYSYLPEITYYSKRKHPDA